MHAHYFMRQRWNVVIMRTPIARQTSSVHDADAERYDHATSLRSEQLGWDCELMLLLLPPLLLLLSSWSHVRCGETCVNRPPGDEPHTATEPSGVDAVGSEVAAATSLEQAAPKLRTGCCEFQWRA